MHYSPLTQAGSMSIRALKKTRAPFSKLGLGFRVSSKDHIIRRLILGPPSDGNSHIAQYGQR